MRGMIRWVALLGLALTGQVLAQAIHDQEYVCKPVYLTLDTGSMRDAVLIADLLRERHIKATFFLASEKTIRGDYSLDDAWAPYWKSLAAEGHAFGSHTLRHGKIGPAASHQIAYKPQFGVDAGRSLTLTSAQFCDELQAVNKRFKAMTGQALDPLWRAPGGRYTLDALAAAQACGFKHVGWDPAGFLGDELNSTQYPNSMLTERALRTIKPGDILVAHLGIWSRQEVFFPALRDIVIGLQNKGYCFRTLRERP